MKSRFSIALTFVVAFAAISLLFSGCGRTRGDDTTTIEPVLVFNEPVTVGDLERNPSDPFLQTAPDGDVVMSWTEQEPGAKDDGRNFMVTTLDSRGESSSEIRQINDQSGQLSSHGGENLAKFTVNDDNGIAAVWTTRGEDYHTGDIWYSHGEETGDFSPAVRLNDDESSQWNHAFSALTTGPDGKLYATWMDGRNRNIIGFDNSNPNKKNKRVYEWDNSQLMMAVSEDGGKSWGANYPISDFRTCSCCRPTIGFVDQGETMVISYRVVADDYLRDQVVMRSTDGAKTFAEPVYISEDGWINQACPHAGVSMDIDSAETIHSLWWTAGSVDEEAGIYYNTSSDGGQSFSPRHLMSRTPPKRVLHTMLTIDKNDTVWATWEEIKDEKAQIFMAYLDAKTGEWSEYHQLSDGTANAMFPVVTTDDSNLYVAWTERKGETSLVKMQTAQLVSD
jgi:hypothetical protein